MNHNKWIWVGGVTLLVIAAISLWYLAAYRPLVLRSVFSVVQGGATGGAMSFGSGDTAESETSSPREVRVRKEVRAQDVTTIIRNLKTVSTFNGYFRSTGVAATINSKSGAQYTIFAPTNGAFAQLPVGTVGSMTAEEKKRLIQNHIVSGQRIDLDAVISRTIDTLSRDALSFSYGPDKIPMVNSAIVITQYEGTNGIVIVVDNVLLPPKR